MREYLKNYINEIDELLESRKKINWENIMKEHLIKISFFQHERFIHLCVTLMYALFALLSLALITVSYIFIIIAVLFFGFLIPYIFHYFFLENGVQYLYKQYDRMKKTHKCVF